ncbi:hypothetical protein, partial [Bacteroides sp. 51]|uniref:hypothetical protein n=1 Tax=Bacteroides sp. 51 TaxID=2302938 RepID=UPI0013D5BEB9
SFKSYAGCPLSVSAWNEEKENPKKGPSAPLHVLLYRAFGWEDTMPVFAHLPLLLKLVTFVPESHVEVVREALFNAG